MTQGYAHSYFSSQIALAMLYWYCSARSDGVCCSSSITGSVAGSVLIAQQGACADTQFRKYPGCFLGCGCSCKATSKEDAMVICNCEQSILFSVAGFQSKQS